MEHEICVGKLQEDREIYLEFRKNDNVDLDYGKIMDQCRSKLCYIF